MTANIILKHMDLPSGYPQFVSPDGKSRIKANKVNYGLRFWGSAQDMHVGLSGSSISSFKDVTGTSYAFNQPNSGNQPILTANQVNGYQAAVFDGINDYATYNFTLPNVGFTWIVCGAWDNTGSPSGERGILGRYTDNARQAGFVRKADGSFVARFADAEVELASSLTSGQFFVATMSWNGSVLKGKFNDGATVEDTPSGVNYPTAALVLGAYKSGDIAGSAWKGAVKSVMDSYSDLLNPVNAAKINDIIDFHLELYGI